MVVFKNHLYEKLKKYFTDHYGYSREFFNTELYKEYKKEIKFIRDNFNGKKVKLEYYFSEDWFSSRGTKIGRIKCGGDRIKFYEGRNRTRFYWLDLGLYEGFRATLIIHKISTIKN